jgi:hypothetical protein
MPLFQEVDLSNGNRWSLHTCEIVIPERQVHGMTAQEIGDQVLRLVAEMPAARDAYMLGWRQDYYAGEPGYHERGVGVATRNPLYYRLVKRDGERCQIPGCRNDILEIDHIVPRSAGGSGKLSNLQLLCRQHNAAKGVSDWMRYLDACWHEFQEEHREHLRVIQEWDAIGYRMEHTHEEQMQNHRWRTGSEAA